jgi:hypothetical protein
LACCFSGSCSTIPQLPKLTYFNYSGLAGGSQAEISATQTKPNKTKQKAPIIPPFRQNQRRFAHTTTLQFQNFSSIIMSVNNVNHHVNYLASGSADW